jgi:hypothetical protein
MVILSHFKNECTENTPQKRDFTKRLFSCFAKWVHFRYSIYARHNRRVYGLPISFLAGNIQQAHIAADYLLYDMMNAYSVYVCPVCHMRR